MREQEKPIDEGEKKTSKWHDKIFFGWWTVLATFIMTFWSSSKGYSFGVYVKPLINEFGWTRAETSIANSLGSMEGGIEGPFGGMATDKYGPRVVSLVGVVIAAIGFFLMYFVNSLWSYILIWGLVLSTGFNLGFMGPMNTAIANWFVKKRGVALGIARVGMAIGGTILPALMTIQLYSIGWRLSFVIAGIITLAIGLPCCWFGVKSKRPEYYGLLPDGEKIETAKVEDTALTVKTGQEYAEKLGEYEFTTRQAVRTWSFWLYTLSTMVRSATTWIIQVHLIPYLTDPQIGLSPIAAAAALGLMTATSAPGRILGGWLSDKVSINNQRWITVISWSAELLGIYFIAFPTSMDLLYLGLAIRGIGLGMQSGARVPMVGRYFGRKSYSTIDGISVTIGLPSRVISPIYAGWVYDVTGNYATAFITLLIFLAIGIILMSFCKPPKPPAKITDVTDIF